MPEMPDMDAEMEAEMKKMEQEMAAYGDKLSAKCHFPEMTEKEAEMFSGCFGKMQKKWTKGKMMKKGAIMMEKGASVADKKKKPEEPTMEEMVANIEEECVEDGDDMEDHFGAFKKYKMKEWADDVE